MDDESSPLAAFSVLIQKCGKSIDLIKDVPKSSVLLLDFRSLFAHVLDSLDKFYSRGSTKEFRNVFRNCLLDFLEIGVSLVVVLDGASLTQNRNHVQLLRHAKEQKWLDGQKNIATWFNTGTDPVTVVDRIWQRVALDVVRSLAKSTSQTADSSPGKLIIRRLLGLHINWKSIVDEYSGSCFALLTGKEEHVLLDGVPVVLFQSVDYNKAKMSDEESEMQSLPCTIHYPEDTVLFLSQFCLNSIEQQSSSSSSNSSGANIVFPSNRLCDLSVLISPPVFLSKKLCDRIVEPRISDFEASNPFQWLCAAIRTLLENPKEETSSGENDGDLEIFAKRIFPNNSKLLKQFVSRFRLARHVVSGRHSQPSQVLKERLMRSLDSKKGSAILGSYEEELLSVDMLQLAMTNLLPHDNRLEPGDGLDMDQRANLLIGRRLAVLLGLEYVEWYGWEEEQVAEAGADGSIENDDDDDESTASAKPHSSSHLVLNKQKNLQKLRKDIVMPCDKIEAIFFILGLSSSCEDLMVRFRDSPSASLPALCCAVMKMLFPEFPVEFVGILQDVVSTIDVDDDEEEEEEEENERLPFSDAFDLGLVFILSCYELSLEWVTSVFDLVRAGVWEFESSDDDIGGNDGLPSHDSISRFVCQYDPYVLTGRLAKMRARIR